VPVERRLFKEIRAVPQTEFSQFSRVYIAPATVTFDKRWLKQYKHDASQRCKSKIQEQYVRVFKEQLEKAFSKDAQLEIVREASAVTSDVLIVKPAVYDLYINGPDFSIAVNQYVRYAGRASASIELRSFDQQILALITDKRDTIMRAVTKPEKTSRVLNLRDFRFLMQRWSNRLIEYVSGE
jgi:hypothetical protein